MKIVKVTEEIMMMKSPPPDETPGDRFRRVRANLQRMKDKVVERERIESAGPGPQRSDNQERQECSEVPKEDSPRMELCSEVPTLVIPEMEEGFYEQRVVKLQASSNACHNNGKFFLDSGAMVHSHDATVTPGTNDKEVKNVRIAGFVGNAMSVKRTQVVKPPTIQGDLALTSMDVPGSSINLVSLGALLEKGCTATMDSKGAKVYHKGKLLMYAKLVNRLLEIQDRLPEDEEKEEDNVMLQAQQISNFDPGTLKMLHDLSGHRNFTYTRKIFNFPPKSREFPDPFCQSCYEAQMCNTKTPSEALTAAPKPGYRIHTDVSAIYPRTDFGFRKDIQRYQLSADEYSGKVWISFLQRKSQCKTEVKRLIGQLNANISPSMVCEHQTDGGKEYLNNDLDSWLKDHKVTPRNSDPYRHYQNGFIESKMDVVDTTSRAMMFRGNAPEGDWPFAANHSVWLENVLPNAITLISHEEMWTGTPRKGDDTSEIEKIGPLFCECMAKVWIKGKQCKEAIRCIYMGKSSQSPGHLVRKIGGKKSGLKLMSASIVSFNPTCFPYTDALIPRPTSKKHLVYDSDSEADEDGIPVQDDVAEVEDDESESDDSSTTIDEEIDPQVEYFDTDDEDIASTSVKPALLKPQESKYDLQPAPEPSDLDYKHTGMDDQSEWVPSGKIGGVDAYKIEAITGERYKKIKGKKQKQFKVKWEGGEWPEEWVLARNISAERLIDEFRQKNKSENSQNAQYVKPSIFTNAKGKARITGISDKSGS